MYYQKIGFKNWEYKPEKYTNNQNKFKYIQGYAIYDIGLIQTPEQLGINMPYPEEYVDDHGYVWVKRIESLSITQNVNRQFSPDGSYGLKIDKVDYTFIMKPYMEGRLNSIEPDDLAVVNGPVFYPNYFKNIRG